MNRKLSYSSSVYLATGITDMRKSINGLAAIVQGEFKIDLFEGAMFVFCNRHRNKIKILHWDKDGFVLYYKRREKGRYVWPDILKNPDGTVSVSEEDMNRLLDGLIMEQFIPRRNYEVM
jgi:transposase